MGYNQKKKHAKHHKNKSAYLTKRILVKAAKEGVTKAAKETMQIMGYHLIARDGWLIKLRPDGRFDKISKIPKEKSNGRIVLD
jgi:hypothetical protein